jgi:hypothetical protein
MERLSPLDVSFLYLEGETTPMHVGGVCVLQPPPEGFDYDRLVRIISDRIATVPRFRQKVRWVPGRLGNPVWVDDTEFDVSYHVRRSALPKPGTEEQLKELTARGRCGRSTSSRASPTAASRSSPRPTTRWSTASPRSTSAR